MGNTTAIQLRHATEANWTSDNPTLAAGEMGLETDTKKIKFGDGTTAWNSLSYITANTTFKYGFYKLSGNQTSNLSATNHVEFDTKINGSLPAPSTGSGQQNGTISLEANKTYKVTAALMVGSSSGCSMNYSIYDVTNTQIINDIVANSKSSTYTGNNGGDAVLTNVFTTSSAIDIVVRIESNSNVNTIYGTNSGSVYSSLLIEEYNGV